jgi:hypothetical protein
LNIQRNTKRFIGVYALASLIATGTHFLFAEIEDGDYASTSAPIGSIIIIQGRLEGRPANRLVWKDLVTGSPLISGQVIRTDSTSGASIKIANAEIEMGADALIVMRFVEGEPTISIDSGQIKISADESSDSKKSLVIAGNGKKIKVAKSVKAEISAVKGKSLDIQTISGSAPVVENIDAKTEKQMAALTPPPAPQPVAQPPAATPPQPEPTAPASALTAAIPEPTVPVPAPEQPKEDPAPPAARKEEPLTAPIIAAPQEGDDFDPNETSELRLKWQKIDNVDGYAIEILDQKGRVFFETSPGADRSQQKLRQMLPGKYTVRIKSRRGGQSSPWSSIAIKVNFQSVDVAAPGQPHIQATSLGDPSNPSLLLKWQPVTGVSTYEIRLTQDGKQIGRQQTTATSFLIPESLDEGQLIVCSIDTKGVVKSCAPPVTIDRQQGGK